jgi:hypothetical protein
MGLIGGCCLTFSSATNASWKALSADVPVVVANSEMAVVPGNSWNQWSFRPSVYGEIWTRDGVSLNELSFFAQIPDGQPIYRELNSRDWPLPKFRSAMLLTDIAELFEASNRSVLQTAVFVIDRAEPIELGGFDGVRIRYHYASPADDLIRRGEAVAAIVDNKLYLINFVAPAIYFFDRDIDDFRAIVASVNMTQRSKRR